MRNNIFIVFSVICLFSSSACGDGSVDVGCLDASECSGGEYCKYPNGTCHEGGLKGECVKIPEICTQIYMPVCGCDDKTYSSSCSAERNSVSIKSEGECPVSN